MPNISRANRAGVAAFLVLVAACGPKTETVGTARVVERDADARVLVFVRDRDGIPECPWEVLGTIEVDPGWEGDAGDRREIERAAARMGGHAVMVQDAADPEARVLRFFDPLCNPLDD